MKTELISPTDSRAGCPYKGFASYWSLRTSAGVHEDVVCGYPTPSRESSQIAGLRYFCNEKVEIEIDAVLETGVVSQFSWRRRTK